ncbi:hypothetical protein N8865_01260 [Francisellaceae bacterium]|nr:hypothetical protein [Francisellaceae bacterium]
MRKKQRQRSGERSCLTKVFLIDEINTEHLMPYYASLNKINSAPAYSSINKLLPDTSNHSIDKSLPVFGVMVETRKHQAIDSIVNNFINSLNIPIQIFHGNNNYDFIMSTSISEWIDKGIVYLTCLNTNDLCAKKYNELFLSEVFWEHVLGRQKILVFQTDTFLCGDSNYRIEDFIEYDYIGSKWPRHRPVGMIMDGGNGGLSLRDWDKTYQCLKRFNPKYWYGGEDGYFAFHMDLIGGKVGRSNECAKFSTQGEFLFKSWGCHQISCLNSKDQADFLNYCPEASFMK